MKALSYKDYTVFDYPKQDEITILGGKEEFKQEEIKELVRVLFEREDFELFKSKVEIQILSLHRELWFKFYVPLQEPKLL
jgi:hypothetical protein